MLRQNFGKQKNRPGFHIASARTLAMASRHGCRITLIALLYAAIIQNAWSRDIAASLPDFAELVRQNKSAVVNISIDEVSTASEPESDRQRGPGDEGKGPQDDSLSDEEYKKFLEEFREGQPRFRSESLGSGFVLTQDGYILTCAHVIEDASRVVVRFSNRKEYEAQVVGTDKRSDVAVLKVDAVGLPTVAIGDPSKLEVGEWVLAIGSPFGFDSSATSGIVSAKGRSLPNESYVPFIQTDVAINPGNSGGPLFDLDGNVVGINAQIYSRTGGFMGLSFAVPIDLAIRVSDQLRENGEVKRGWLGVAIQEVTADLADSLGMETPSGALISDVIAEGPAASSELQPGDVIIAFNSAAIAKMSDLPPVVGSTLAGSTASVDVIRNGEQIVLEVTLGELTANPELSAATEDAEPNQSSQSDETETAPDDESTVEESDSDDSSNASQVEEQSLGLVLEPPTEDERIALQLPEGGLIVRSVSSGVGMRTGVKEGDLILRLASTDIYDSDQFRNLITDLEAEQDNVESDEEYKSVPLLIRRGVRNLFLAMKLQ